MPGMTEQTGAVVGDVDTHSEIHHVAVLGSLAGSWVIENCPVRDVTN